MRKRIILPLLMVFYLLLTTVSCNNEILPVRDAKAHIICVGLDYSNTNETQLRGSIDDAAEMGFCLREIYEKRGIETDMKIMLAYTDQASNYDLYPTADAVIKAVKDIDAQENDLIVFYFSGHAGYDADDENQDVYLGLARTGSEMVTRFYVKDLYNILETKGCACAVILDACYSGNMTVLGDDKQTFEEAFKNITSFNGIRNISVMASSAAGQESGNYYMSNEYHGFFTYSLLEMLGWEHDPSHIGFTYEDQGYAYEVHGDLAEEPKTMSTWVLYNKLMTEWYVAGQDPTINNTSYNILIVPYIGNGEYTPYGSPDDEGVTIIFQVQTSVSGTLEQQIVKQTEDSVTYKLTYVAAENSKWPTYFIWTVDGEFLTDASRDDYYKYQPTMQSIEYTMDYAGRSTITCLAVVSSGGGGSLYGATSGTSCSSTMDTMDILI